VKRGHIGTGKSKNLTWVLWLIGCPSGDHVSCLISITAMRNRNVSDSVASGTLEGLSVRVVASTDWSPPPTEQKQPRKHGMKTFCGVKYFCGV
jgi:hypothetical protein